MLMLQRELVVCHDADRATRLITLGLTFIGWPGNKLSHSGSRILVAFVMKINIHSDCFQKAIKYFSLPTVS